MPLLTKQVISQYLRTECQRQLRLTLSPANNQRYRPGFLRRVVAFSVPAGTITAIGVFVAYAVARAENVEPDAARTAATVVAMIIGLAVLLLVARPLHPWKIALVAAMGGLFVLIMLIPATRDFFELGVPASTLAESVVIGSLGAVAVAVVSRVAERATVDLVDDREVVHVDEEDGRLY